jgi:hypothetical protein
MTADGAVEGPRHFAAQHARDGTVEAVAHTMGPGGATWQTMENAATKVLSLASVHTYRCRPARNASVLEKLLQLLRAGPASTRKDGGEFI